MIDAAALTRRLGGRWNVALAYGCARCPAHDDLTPSLSIRDGDHGVLLKCHAGCSSRNVLAVLGRRGLLDKTPRARSGAATSCRFGETA